MLPLAVLGTVRLHPEVNCPGHVLFAFVNRVRLNQRRGRDSLGRECRGITSDFRISIRANILTSKKPLSTKLDHFKVPFRIALGEGDLIPFSS